ncbi:MAG: hypothetical protein F4Y57_14330, partial [Acidobacteria bacterium]|nr:hypothetical protein [Acidobacteriota bacterium]
MIPLRYEKPEEAEVAARARRFYEEMNRRRTVRDFSPEPVPAEVIEELVRAASTAPARGRPHTTTGGTGHGPRQETPHPHT